MNEKVILNRPNGEQTEVSVFAHFKYTGDKYPNINNVPILICRTGKIDNGNEVLDFYYEKSGLYQPINDPQAWQEVKNLIIEIIKGIDVKMIKKINGVAFNTNLENAKPLALKPELIQTLLDNYNKKVVSAVNDIQVSDTPLETPSVIEPTPVGVVEQSQSVAMESPNVAPVIDFNNGVLQDNAPVVEQAQPAVAEVSAEPIEDAVSIAPQQPVEINNNNNEQSSLDMLGEQVEEFDRQEREEIEAEINNHNQIINTELDRHNKKIIDIRNKYAKQKADNFARYKEGLAKTQEQIEENLKDSKAKLDLATQIANNADAVQAQSIVAPIEQPVFGASVDISQPSAMEAAPSMETPVFDLNTTMPTAPVTEAPVAPVTPVNDTYTFENAPINQTPVLTLTPPTVQGSNQQAA